MTDRMEDVRRPPRAPAGRSPMPEDLHAEMDNIRRVFEQHGVRCWGSNTFGESGYRNQSGGTVSEVLSFDGPLVREGHGTYLPHAPLGLSG